MSELTDFNNVLDRFDAVKAKQAEIDKEYRAVRQEVLAKCVELCATFRFTAKELGIAQSSSPKRSRRASAKQQA